MDIKTLNDVTNYIEYLGYSYLRETPSLTKDGYIKFNLRWDDSNPSKSIYVYVRPDDKRKLPSDKESVERDVITQKHKKKVEWKTVSREVELFSSFKSKFDASVCCVNNLSSFQDNTKRLSHPTTLTTHLGKNLLIPLMVYKVWELVKEAALFDLTDTHVIVFFGVNKEIIIKFPLNKLKERPFILKQKDSYLKDNHLMDIIQMMILGAQDLFDTDVLVTKEGFTFNLNRNNQFEINFPKSVKDNTIQGEYVFNINDLKTLFKLEPDDVAFYYEELPTPGIRNLQHSAIQFIKGEGGGMILGKVYR